MKLSKILSLVLTFVLLFSVPAFAGFYDVPPSAVSYEAVTFLSDLEIINGYQDMSFKPNANITRAEYATIICRIIGMEEGGRKNSIDVFTDVPADHWANGYIATAYFAGIVNGMGDGTFAPEAEVTYEQAVKMLVCALGYERRAEELGGYPDGYMTIARQESILVATENPSAPASRATVARLTYNALTVPMMDQISWGENPKFDVVPTLSLLWSKLDAVKVEATIVQVRNDDITISAATADKVAQANQYVVPKMIHRNGIDVASLQGTEVVMIIDRWYDDQPRLLSLLAKSELITEQPEEDISFAGPVSYYRDDRNRDSVIPTYESITGARQTASALSYSISNADFTRYFYTSTRAEVNAYIAYLESNGWIKNGTETVSDSKGKGEGIGFSHIDSDGYKDAQVAIYYYPDSGDVDVLAVLKQN